MWDELYKAPASQELTTLGITGVVIPESHFVANPDLVSTRSFSLLFSRLHTGASTEPRRDVTRTRSPFARTSPTREAYGSRA